MGRFASLMGRVEHCYYILGGNIAQNIVDLVKDIPAAGAKYLQALSNLFGNLLRCAINEC